MLLSSATNRHARRLGACLLAVATLASAACGRDTPAQVGVTTYDVGDREQLPGITGRTLDGRPLTLPIQDGTITILNAWASWCDPCREEMPILADLDGQFGKSQVAVIGLNVQDNAADAATFLDDVGVTFPSIADDDGSLLATIPGVPPKAVPSTVILDRSGAIAVRIIGPLDRRVVTEAVQALLAEEMP